MLISPGSHVIIAPQALAAKAKDTCQRPRDAMRGSGSGDASKGDGGEVNSPIPSKSSAEGGATGEGGGVGVGESDQGAGEGENVVSGSAALWSLLTSHTSSRAVVQVGATHHAHACTWM